MLGLLFPLAFLNGWLGLRLFQYLEPFVTIFVLAILLAFILNYPVQFLQQRGLKHNYAVFLVFLPALLILLALGVTIIPIVLAQFHEIAKLVPQWISSSSQELQILDDWAISRRLPVDLGQLVNQLTDRLPDELQYLADQFFNLAVDTIDSLSEVVLTVVLTFYLLIDGERLWDGVAQRSPSSFSPQVRQALQQNFQNYFIGQIALASLVGFSMTLMFLVLRVHFGLLFGLTVGVMSLIPFGDVLSLSVIILLLASHNFWLAVKVAAVAVVIDQVIDQAIAPRLLGRFTGLRPVWVLVALLVGTKIGGLLGLLVAVPLASFIKSAADGFPPALVDAASSAVPPSTHTQDSTPQNTNAN
jgi:predicted PurR-regulated permease PerM